MVTRVLFAVCGILIFACWRVAWGLWHPALDTAYTAYVLLMGAMVAGGPDGGRTRPGCKDCRRPA